MTDERHPTSEPPSPADVLTPPARATQDSWQTAGLEMVGTMMGAQAAARATAPDPSALGNELFPLAVNFVFGGLWSRPGLSLRDRSLLTLGMLIALKSDDELKVHFPLALKNGVTRQEIEEIIYHSCGYAGFPAAVSARATASAVIK